MLFSRNLTFFFFFFFYILQRDVVSSPPASTSTTNNNSNRRYVAPSSEDEEEERLSASDALNLKNQLQSDARRQKELENSRRGRLSIAPPVAPIPVPSRVDIERDGRDVSGAGKKDKGREVGKSESFYHDFGFLVFCVTDSFVFFNCSFLS